MLLLSLGVVGDLNVWEKIRNKRIKLIGADFGLYQKANNNDHFSAIFIDNKFRVSIDR